jgi:hypothetical protein
MITYQKTTAHWPAKHPDRELASASATDRHELLASTWIMAQGGETSDGEDPVRRGKEVLIETVGRAVIGRAVKSVGQYVYLGWTLVRVHGGQAPSRNG